MPIEECRQFYAEEIRFTANISSPRLVEAFGRVPRESFLGPGPWEIAAPDFTAMAVAGKAQLSYTEISYPHQVYHDVLIALDKAGDINNGQPSGLARWIDALDLQAGDRVHHLGCGVGYYTAIMAEMVGVDGTVTGSEINAALAARATQNLTSYRNVVVYAGDGASFDAGPCDAIFVNTGVTHPLPLWLNALREGGRLMVPLTMAVTASVGAGFMTKITRRQNAFSAEFVSQVGICSCTAARDPQLNEALRSAISSGALLQMKSVRTDAHDKADTCLLHGTQVCMSSAAAGS